MSERATDFLPCPHCGSADIRVDRHIGEGRGIDHQGDDIWSMCCNGCGARAVNRYRREVLRDAWNRRAPTAPNKALEFAEYLAKGAERLLEAMNAEDAARMAMEEDADDTAGLEAAFEAAQSARGEFATGLRSRVYEFRKRAEKVQH